MVEINRSDLFFFHIDLKEKIMKRDSLQRRLIPEAGYSFNVLVHLIRKTMMSLTHHCMREEMGCNKFRDDFKQLKWELNHPAALDCTELCRHFCSAFQGVLG